MNNRIYGISEGMIQARRFHNFLLTYAFIAFFILTTMFKFESIILDTCVKFVMFWLILCWYGPEFGPKFAFKTNDFAAWVAWQMEKYTNRQQRKEISELVKGSGNE